MLCQFRTLFQYISCCQVSSGYVRLSCYFMLCKVSTGYVRIGDISVYVGLVGLAQVK
jgi:hypothetical protein